MVLHLLSILSGDTSKSEVVRFATRQAESCSRDEDEQQTDELSIVATVHDPDEALLWKLLVLLCRQNGVRGIVNVLRITHTNTYTKHTHT